MLIPGCYCRRFCFKDIEEFLHVSNTSIQTLHANEIEGQILETTDMDPKFTLELTRK